MASEAAPQPAAAIPKTVPELVAKVKAELDADAERQAKVSAAGVVGDLATLDLSHLDLKALPVEVVEIIKDKVERLALSHNLQINIPSQIVQCDRLRYLNIRWNQLKHFPEPILQLTGLEILDLSKNRIGSIPEGIKSLQNLKFLAVARNKITRLPLALGDMPSLSKLKFDENPITFPPEHVWRQNSANEHVLSSIEAEKEKDVCVQVKKFLKAASLRERLKAPSEEELSESNVETPRPPKRSVTGGRFPVRPSISGIESMDELKTQSPADAPPIPLRSHARNLSTNASLLKRPGIAPLLTDGNDISRSRSETASISGSLKSRRTGIIGPKKSSNLAQTSISTFDEDKTLRASVRTSQASTIKASHSRASSSVSTLNGFLSASSGETSSGAVSPIDGPGSRYGPSRPLSSLPENRNSKVQTSEVLRAAKRLLFCFMQLYGPVGEVTRTLKDGTPKRSMLERQLFSANAHVEELERLLSRMESTFEDDYGRSNEKELNSIVLTCVAALKAYALVVKELRQHAHKIVSLTEGLYLRCLMQQIYMTMVECRNVCTLLGFKTRQPTPRSEPRTSRAWSSRTVTPTQPSKPINTRRLRGATILQNLGNGSSTSLRVMPPPVPLNGGGSSRTNTMTSLSTAATATPRSSESFSGFSSATSSAAPSRTNTMRSGMPSLLSDFSSSSPADPMVPDEHFDRIYLRLANACDLARQLLPHCRAEIAAHAQTDDPRQGHPGYSGQQGYSAWARALTKCDTVIATNSTLNQKLKHIRLKDPGVLRGGQREFWQLCDAFVQAWADLATEVKELAQRRPQQYQSQQQQLRGGDRNGGGPGGDRVDISNVKAVMRPVQKAVKEVSKAISESPLYHQAVRQVVYPGSSTAALGYPQQINGGYVTPVPATPLSAALGPAVQATVAGEYFQQGTGQQLPPVGLGMVTQRADTMLQQPPSGLGLGRR